MVGSDLTRATLLEHLDNIGEARLSAAAVAQALRSGNMDSLVADLGRRCADRPPSSRQKAAELEAAGWTCTPPRETLVPTSWAEVIPGGQWERLWGGTTSLCALVRPSTPWPPGTGRIAEGERWMFRVRLYGARSSGTGAAHGSASTPEEAQEKADRQLQVLVEHERRRRSRLRV
jgi:hypothetical protein